jgi:hypothetical protein
LSWEKKYIFLLCFHFTLKFYTTNDDDDRKETSNTRTKDIDDTGVQWFLYSTFYMKYIFQREFFDCICVRKGKMRKIWEKMKSSLEKLCKVKFFFTLQFFFCVCSKYSNDDKWNTPSSVQYGQCQSRDQTDLTAPQYILVFLSSEKWCEIFFFLLSIQFLRRKKIQVKFEKFIRIHVKNCMLRKNIDVLSKISIRFRLTTLNKMKKFYAYH